MKKGTIDQQALGILLHFGHIFSGYKIPEIANFGKGFVMGITIALDSAGKVNSDVILPGETIDPNKAAFGIEQFLRAFFFSWFFDRSALAEPIKEFNEIDLSAVMTSAKEEMIRLAGSKRPFFVDPGNKNKQ